jgi:hypothetical protein
MIKRILVSIATLGLSLAFAHSASAVQPFGPETVDELRDRYRDATALLLLWSLGCHHCKDGMARAAALRADDPELNLVLINVDPPDEATEVEQVLDAHGLNDADNWQFIDAPAARLRAALDPSWYGELPRSYLIEADGSVHGFSGRISQELLDYWRERSRGDDTGQ